MGLLRPPKERPGNTEEYLETIHGPDDGKREQYDPMARVFIGETRLTNRQDACKRDDSLWLCTVNPSNTTQDGTVSIELR